MSIYLAIAVGGAVGAVSRYWMYGSVGKLLGYSFPFGTLTVNLLGSLLMGFLSVILTDRLPLDAPLRLGLLIGMLGSFTTFSAFAMDTLILLQTGAVMKSLLYVTANLVLCVIAVWAGLLFAKLVV